MDSSLPDPLVVMALRLEGQEIFERAGVPVVYTGVGKINAAWALTRKLCEYRHAGLALPLVLNFGTTGSRCFATHAVVACSAFVQHDMDVTGLGVARGTTPYDDSPAKLAFPQVFPQLTPAVCGTGDCFQTSEISVLCEVVDMEAYALAKVCYLEGARFACVKYVTDGADHAAGSDWHGNLHRAAEQFWRCYANLTG
ncbi:MAG TPA: 5'-nucleosidase [Gammaproteobacteria bacterium]|nr:5'-nucleosidase [Gammaproteobacteria bacterium]